MRTHEKVRQLRTERRLSEKQVYTAIGMPQQTYSNKELGLHKFYPDELQRLADFFGVDVSVFDEEKPNAAPAAAEPGAGLDLMQVVVTLQNSQIQFQNGQLELWQRVDRLERELAENRKKKAPVKRKKGKGGRRK